MFLTWAKSRTAVHKAPLWEMNAMLPAAGMARAKLAFSFTCGSVLIAPRQFGPTIACRTSGDRLDVLLAFDSGGPDFTKPADMMIAPLMPFWPHCSRPSRKPPGKTRIAKSTSSGMSST